MTHQKEELWDQAFKQALHSKNAASKKPSPLGIKSADIPSIYKKIYNGAQMAERFPQAQNAAHLSCFFHCDEKGHILLNVQHPDSPLSLYEIVPIFTHMGLSIQQETSFVAALSDSQKVFWHLLFLKELLNPSTFKKTEILIEEALKAIFSQKTETDSFHQLILGAQLSWQECRLIRAYARYLKQIQARYSDDFITTTLLKYPSLTRALLDLFHNKLDPHRQDLENPEEDEKPLSKKITEVSTHLEERLFSYLFNLIRATLRTNFYQVEAHTKEAKNYLSLKFRCDFIEDLPSPKPFYEIFVYAPFVEGVHLRSGKIGRGGLRWSDRKEDYRDEILGLMQTQVIKNAIIVPVGAKGGFIFKDIPKGPTPQEAYDTFIKGLLDLTDNLVDGVVKLPLDVRRLDEDDPYLVVAADKGTATCSDAANAISKAYHFWLGDAFATGGKNGYDHKKMGITARGTWESVEHHFEKKGISLDKPFTVVGVGDMSGDVFGNGMLGSKNIRLLGAFDHRHIFLDPDPDTTTSYAERKRLFHLKRSSWKDYNPETLSKGGGIFDRTLRTIPLSKEIQNWLGLDVPRLTNHELIKALLRAPVDLLWFGGIGTFIKSQDESQFSIADRSNDLVRINGADLKAKVVGEGANLGLTQKGRVEFALQGGAINTDALDNSAGVTCSDHEVNIKILLDQRVAKKELPQQDRDTLMKDMTKEVAELVLSYNRTQNIAVGIVEDASQSLFEHHCSLIHFLHQGDFLDAQSSNLPNEEELQKRRNQRRGLTRPEIATLLAHSKINFKTHMHNASFITDPACHVLLKNYFPQTLVTQYSKALLKHPLKRQIITNQLGNNVLNALGPGFIADIYQLTKASYNNITKSLCLAAALLGVDFLNPTSCSQERYAPEVIRHTLISAWNKKREIKRLVIWFLRYANLSDAYDTLVKRYFKGFQTLDSFFSSQWLREHADPLITDETLLSEKKMLQALAPDMIQVSKASLKSLTHIAPIYYLLTQELGLLTLNEQMNQFPFTTYWQRRALDELKEQIFFIQQQFTLHVATQYPETKAEESVESWLKKAAPHLKDYQELLTKIHLFSPEDIAPFMVLSYELQRCYEKLVGTCLMTISFQK